MKWCLGGCCVWQKSPVEVHHAQKTAELTGGLGRVAVLEIGYSIFQKLGTFGRHLVTDEVTSGAQKTHCAWLMRIPYL
jgi:hypothetical protein